MRTHALLGLAALLSVSTPAIADSAWNPHGVEIRVTIGGSQTRFFPASESASGTTQYQHMLGRLGTGYSIVVKETRGIRSLACIAVDGQSILADRRITTPERAQDWGGACYVLDPFRSATIPGWRISKDAVRQFIFTADKNALAARKWGDYGAIGTIVVAVFHENLPTDSDDVQTRDLGPRTKGLGTGAGARVESHVREVAFDPLPYAAGVAVIHYDTESGLRQIGVWRDDDSTSFGRFGDQREYIDLNRD